MRALGLKHKRTRPANSNCGSIKQNNPETNHRLQDNQRLRFQHRPTLHTFVCLIHSLTQALLSTHSLTDSLKLTCTYSLPHRVAPLHSFLLGHVNLWMRECLTKSIYALMLSSTNEFLRFVYTLTFMNAVMSAMLWRVLPAREVVQASDGARSSIYIHTYIHTYIPKPIKSAKMQPLPCARGGPG